MANAQSACSSLRYQDTIFHSVSIDTGIYFASAVPYGSDSPENLYLDIYQPAGDTVSTRPIIVYQFGGGFVIGWREEPDIPQYCTYFAQLGYVVATIDYRIGLDPTDTGSTLRAFYRAVQDERSAIRFLSQNASQYRIDTTRIILTGTSAGCFCSFANVYMNDSLRPPSTYGTTLEPTDLGCMDCSGNADLGHHIPHPLAIFNMWGAILDTNYILNRLGVPTISFQGTLDDLVPYTYGYPFNLPVFPPVYGAVPINERQTNQGIPNVLHPLVGYGHEPELTAPWLNDTIYNYGRRFLWPLLQPQTSAITGDSVVCQRSVAHYSVINTPGSWYCWQLTGNGSILADSNNAITVIWQDTGTVGVSVTEMNDIDAQGNPQYFTSHVISHTQPAFTDSASQLLVTFTNNSTGQTSNYWSFGNGDTSTGINPVENYYPSPGTYHIELYTSNNYCTDSTGKTITIDSCPVAAFTAQVTGMNVVFDASTTNTSSYFWNFGDGDSSTVGATNVFHPYSQPGTYLVTLKVRNKLGCESVDTLSVTVTEPSAIGDISNPTASIVCDNTEGCYIKCGNTGPALIEVYDITGQRLFSQSITGNYFLPTSTLAPGIYLIKLSGDSLFEVKKVLKQ